MTMMSVTKNGNSLKSFPSDLNRIEHSPSFVHSLLKFGFGYTVGHDTCPDLQVGDFVVDDHGSERDARVHVACEVNVTHRVCVGSAARGFNLVDDFHGPHLGRSRYCSS